MYVYLWDADFEALVMEAHSIDIFVHTYQKL